MMEFSILLEACDPERNRWRSYRIMAGQDLFGDWVVELTYGRIGSRGATPRSSPWTMRPPPAAMCRPASGSEKLRPKGLGSTIR